MKRALITGINGQDGFYLADLLLGKGYEVFGIGRSDPRSLFDRVTMIKADVNDFDSLRVVIRDIRPDEVYNLASQSHVNLSFEQPLLTARTAGMGAVNVFESVRLERPQARVFQASSSAMYGNCVDEDGFQRETTGMEPASPYASAKLFAHNIARNYRSAYHLFISNGILFNHESPLRGTNFVTSKICHEAVRIKYGVTDRLDLGNTEARRDWGHAKDYVRAMWMILQHHEPDDFVCATGTAHSVGEVVEFVFARLELDPEKYLNIDSALLRPEDRQISTGDSAKRKEATGWQAEYTFDTMLDEMIYHWLAELPAAIPVRLPEFYH